MFVMITLIVCFKIGGILDKITNKKIGVKKKRYNKNHPLLNY